MSAEASLVTEVTTLEFPDEVVKSALPVLVDFWAPWCGPCLQLAPVVEELAAEYEGRLRVVKVDVDREPALAASFGIRSIPTLMMYQEGSPREVSAGMKSAGELRTLIGQYLPAAQSG